MSLIISLILLFYKNTVKCFNNSLLANEETTGWGGCFGFVGFFGGGSLLKGKEKQTKKCVSESKNKNN